MTWSISLFLPDATAMDRGLYFTDEMRATSGRPRASYSPPRMAGKNGAVVPQAAPSGPIRFADRQVGWIVRAQTVIYTSDGGKRWNAGGRSIFRPKHFLRASGAQSRLRGRRSWHGLSLPNRSDRITPRKACCQLPHRHTMIAIAARLQNAPKSRMRALCACGHCNGELLKKSSKTGASPASFRLYTGLPGAPIARCNQPPPQRSATVRLGAYRQERRYNSPRCNR